MRKKFYPSALLFLFLLFVPLMAQEEIESAQNTQNAEAKVREPQKIITLQNNIVVTNLVGDSLLIGTDFGEVLELKLEAIWLGFALYFFLLSQKQHKIEKQIQIVSEQFDK